ncbi:uncharacterized protein [Henckelia pumila]|uniref:uncharacterized protein n=1 Tax=Henckelia pumila TaxID=405737 RepID=UPI003C6E97AA
MIIELTEDKGDTFAERADMYYQKRPQLIKLLQELYTSCSSLADKYDQHLLKSESSVKPPTNPGSASNSSINSLQKGKPNPHCTLASSSLSESSDQHLATGSALVNSGDREEKEAAGNNVDDATKFSRLLEEILSQQAELIRRNDEKRETIVELRNEIKILKSDPRKQKKKLMRGLFCMP